MFGLFHMAGWYFLEHAWAVDRPVHLVHRADAARAARPRSSAGARARCTPSRRSGNASSTTARAYDTSSLREVLTGTSRVDLDLVDALKARFPGSWTSVAYGSTEIGRGAVLADADLYDEALERRVASSRRRGADRRRRRTAAPRPDDVLRATSTGPTPPPTAIDADGWFHTGDLATQDADGYLTITGRRSEGIRSGGEWIAPVEVEAAVLTHPAVAEVGCRRIARRPMGRAGVRGDRRATRRNRADRRGAPRAPRVEVWRVTSTHV